MTSSKQEGGRKAPEEETMQCPECNSTNVTADADHEGLYDCLNCGVWFDEREPGALEEVRKVFPEAQTHDIDSPFYTEITDQGHAYVHGGGAYPFVLKNVCKPI